MSNCRPGDLAIRKRTGQLVHVLRAFTGDEWFVDTAGERHLFIHSGDPPAWVVESCGSTLKSFNGSSALGQFFCRVPIKDSALRPIRNPGEDATDEMLQRVGKPESAAIEWALGVRDVTPL